MTLRDVARQAGVSPTAVSFAYNAPHQLSTTTREHILDTAEVLGYQPHPVARTLATGRTNAIGLLVPTSLNWMLHDPLFTHFLGEVGAGLRPGGEAHSAGVDARVMAPRPAPKQRSGGASLRGWPRLRPTVS